VGAVTGGRGPGWESQARHSKAALAVVQGHASLMVCCAVLCRTLPLCESSREDVLDSIAAFVSPRRGQPPYHCLIISYETFRLHAARLAVPGACDLLICDEVCVTHCGDVEACGGASLVP
jgi:hypothetical protein